MYSLICTEKVSGDEMNMASWLYVTSLAPTWYYARDSDSKESAFKAGDPGLIPGLRKIPWRKKWQPAPVFLPGEFHGQRRLVGYTVHGVTKSQTGLSN